MIENRSNILPEDNAMQQPKARSEMDPQWMWNLNDILDGVPAFDDLYAATETAVGSWQK